MGRKKLFIENIFAYGFINIINKIVPFLLLPVITRMLPDASDFGVYSMYTTIVGFGIPLAVLGLYDAMFREYFEKDDKQYRYNVTTTTQKMTMISSLTIMFILVLFNKSFSSLFFGNNDYGKIIILAAIGIFLGGIKSPIQAPTRMENQRKVFVATGLISSLVTYVLALILIYYGFSYYGLIYSSITSTIVLLFFFGCKNRAFFIKGYFTKSIAKELLKIGLPLVPTFLIYWIYNSMDKIMISNMLSTFDLGIYSIGASIAQISQLIYAGFAGGWQYFAFSTMKDNDQVELNSKVFEYLGAITVISFIGVYPFFPLIFRFLFSGDYILGQVVAPYLFLSPLLLMLFQVVANQFLVIKKSYLSTISLFIGAVLNVVLNLVLINIIGIEGAAVATLSSYYVTVVLVMVISEKMKLMLYSIRIISVLAIIPMYIFFQRIVFVEFLFIQICITLFGVLLIIYLFRSELKLIKLLKRFKSKSKFK